MATYATDKFIEQLRRAVLFGGGPGLTDASLLRRFAEERDNAAFEAIVRRHGPMVWGVCRRILSNSHDAEDAFQATFLVLVRKAASLRPRDMVGSWLYGVAHQTAIRTRALNIKRSGREKQVTTMPHPHAALASSHHDLQEWLDEELSRLPDKYRAAIVLCDLEGKTRAEAAQQLGWPEGSVSGRLARGRAMLAKRLAKHGPSLSVAALAAELSHHAASASLPASLVSTTFKAVSMMAAGQTAATALISAKVAAITEGVLKAMFLTKLKSVSAMILAVGLVTGGVGGVSYRTVATAQTQNREGADAKNANRSRDDAELRQAMDEFEAAKVKLQQANRIHEEARKQVLEAHYRLEAAKQKRRPIEGNLTQVNVAESSVELTWPVLSDDSKQAWLIDQLEGRELPRTQSIERLVKSFRVNSDAVILQDNVKVRLSDLKINSQIALSLDAQSTTVVKLEAHGGKIGGRFVSSNLPRKTLVVDHTPSAERMTYHLVKETEIIAASGKTAQLADIKEGSWVLLTRSVDDANTVIRIEVAPSSSPERKDAAPPVKDGEKKQDNKSSRKEDKMFPDGRDHDFGIVARGATVSHAFRVVNTTGKPIELTSVRVSCGCLSGAASTQFLNPNTEGTVEIAVDTSRFLGAKTTSLLLAVKSAESIEDFRFTISANSQDEQKPAAQDELANPERLRAFSMNNKPWREVIEWLVDQSGLSYISSQPTPTGTFKFISPKGATYTLPEVVDIINDGLAAHKCILIRRDVSFTITSAVGPIDPSNVPRVAVKDLSKRGKTEIVQVIVPLKVLNAERFAPEAKKLMGPLGTATPVTRTNVMRTTHLLLQDSAGNLRRVIDRINELDIEMAK